MTGTLYGHPLPDRPRPADGRPGKLTTISVLVGIVGGVATVVGTVWALLPDRDRPVVAYQQQVLAACQQVRAVLTKEHPEVVRLDPKPGATDPDDMLRIRKPALLAVLNSNLEQARASFDLLNQQPVPGRLRDKQQAAKRAQDQWLAFHSNVAATIRTKIRDGDRLSRLTALGLNTLEGSGRAHTELNAAMTALAGEDCRCTQ